MYYQNYEDYMRQVLGYPSSDPNIYETYDYTANRASENTYYSNQLSTTLTENEIQSLYPDCYNTIYPIVCRVCEANTEPITRESVERLTNEVYNLVESNGTVVNVRVETQKNDNRESSSSSKSRSEIKTDNNTSKRTHINSENREMSTPKQETRQSNFLLRDLIRILILQRLFGGGHRPHRPRPSRPPFPGGPGRPPFPDGRLPMEPRIDRNYFDY